MEKMETQLQHLCSKMTFCCCFQLGNSGLERSQPAKFVGRGEGPSGGVVAPLCKGHKWRFFNHGMSHVSTNFQQFPAISTNFNQFPPKKLKFRTCQKVWRSSIILWFRHHPTIIPSWQVVSPLIFAHIRAAGPFGKLSAAVAFWRHRKNDGKLVWDDGKIYGFL